MSRVEPSPHQRAFSGAFSGRLAVMPRALTLWSVRARHGEALDLDAAAASEPLDSARLDRIDRGRSWLLRLYDAERRAAHGYQSMLADVDRTWLVHGLGNLSRSHATAAELLGKKLDGPGWTAVAEVDHWRPLSDPSWPLLGVTDRLAAMQRAEIELARLYCDALAEPELPDALRWSLSTSLLPAARARVVRLDELIERS